MHANELWESDELTARLARTALLPLSGLYALGWEAYLAVYRLRLKHPAHPHSPTICVGNLVVGGAGKTPVTQLLARTIVEMGKEVVIGCSGYGSPHAEAAAIAPSGPLAAAEWGDEPAMLRWLMPEIPLVVGRRRVLAAELVQSQFPNGVLLMDDGFQHLPLDKDLTILLDQAQPKNRFCLPAGPYREPRWNRKRADIVVPGNFRVEPTPTQFVDADSNRTEIKGEYAVLCALGQPQRFLDALKSSLGRPPYRQKLCGDHDPLTGGTLLEEFGAEQPIVVTAKDWVKLKDRSDKDSYRFVVALHEVRIEPETEFRDWILGRLSVIEAKKQS